MPYSVYAKNAPHPLPDLLLEFTPEHRQMLRDQAARVDQTESEYLRRLVQIAYVEQFIPPLAPVVRGTKRKAFHLALSAYHRGAFELMAKRCDMSRAEMVRQLLTAVHRGTYVPPRSAFESR